MGGFKLIEWAYGEGNIVPQRAAHVRWVCPELWTPPNSAPTSTAKLWEFSYYKNWLFVTMLYAFIGVIARLNCQSPA